MTEYLIYSVECNNCLDTTAKRIVMECQNVDRGLINIARHSLEELGWSISNIGSLCPNCSRELGETYQKCKKCGGSGDMFLVISEGIKCVVRFDELPNHRNQILGDIECNLCGGSGVEEG